jgi:hypothetical protein
MVLAEVDVKVSVVMPVGAESDASDGASLS